MTPEFSDFVDAVATSTYQVHIKIDSEYWLDIEKYMHSKIIPEHIFEDVSGIGYDGWNTWNPVINGADPHVTSGPFYVSDYSSGIYELSRKTDYYWLQGVITTTTTTTSTTTTTTATTPTGGLIDLDPLTIMISIGSIGVILVVAILVWKSKQS